MPDKENFDGTVSMEAFFKKLKLIMNKMINRFRISICSNLHNYLTKIVMLLSMLLPLMALSQKTITGKVFDASNNKPLVPAFIIPRGSSSGISTDHNGNFT